MDDMCILSIENDRMSKNEDVVVCVFVASMFFMIIQFFRAIS